MGASIGYTPRAQNPAANRVSVVWYPNGTSSPTSIHGRGVASVERTATGAFTVTLSDKWRSVFPNAPQLVSASSTGVVWTVAEIGDGLRGVTSASSYVKVECRANGTLVNLAAGTTEMVSMALDIADSALLESTY